MILAEAALLALACTLFVNMGLSDAIQEFLGIKFKILSCVKCFTFWSVLVYLTFRGARLYQVVSASFVFSYLALWLDLGLSALNKIYNESYQQILSAEADKTDASPSGGKHHKSREGGSDVSSVRKKKVKHNGNSL